MVLVGPGQLNLKATTRPLSPCKDTSTGTENQQMGMSVTMGYTMAFFHPSVKFS